MRRIAIGVLVAAACSHPRPLREDLHDVMLRVDGDPRTSIAVTWQGCAGAYVRFGTSPYAMTRVAFDAGDHYVRLGELSAGTFYSYQIVGERSASPVYTFHTASARPEAETVIGVLGDPGDRIDVWQQLAAGLTERAPDVIVVRGRTYDTPLFASVPVTTSDWALSLTASNALVDSFGIIRARGSHVEVEEVAADGRSLGVKISSR